jgi:hypothetical protein
MSLPTLQDFDKTKAALHLAIQVLGRFRLAAAGELSNAMQYGVYSTEFGATTGNDDKLKGRLDFNYGMGTYEYIRNGAVVFSININTHSQISLYQSVKSELESAGVRLDVTDNHITETDKFNINLEDAGAFAAFKWRTYGMLARLKAQMFGPQTPIILWPHGFDQSTLWFVDGMNEHEDPQMNFGFSPGTSDVGQPYFYFYAWPLPDGLAEKLPAAIEWNTEWSTPGGVLTYEKFASESHPDSFVVDVLSSVYQIGSVMMRANN